MLKKLTSMLVIVLVILAVASYFLYQKYFIAATVNGKKISRLTIVEELEKQGGKKVLDSVITQELIVERAKKDKISISQSQIDAEIKKIEENVTSQGTTLDAALVQKGMTKDDLVKEIKLQLIVQKLAKTDEIKITDKDVEKYLADNKDQFPADSKTRPSNDQIKDTLKQQKVQEKIQEFLTNLRKDAKVEFFGSYK